MIQVLHFRPGQPPTLAEAQHDADQANGFFWLDIQRSEQDWHDMAQPWLKLRLHERHAVDTFNDAHPPYFDTTDDYEFIVVRALCPDCPAQAPTTRAIVFVVTEHLIASIRPAADPAFNHQLQLYLSGQRGAPTSVAMLLYQLMNQITDALLIRRDMTSTLLSDWQVRLLDPNDQFKDWQSLMHLRSHLQRLEVVSEMQIDALAAWREQTRLPIDKQLAVRFNDVQEHTQRIYNHVLLMQHDIDALIQVYFSSNTQRTNEILQFLAIISAVFLPLNLMAGIFGTNFANLPMLSVWYGPLAMAAAMSVVVLGLLVWFRHRRWL